MTEIQGKSILVQVSARFEVSEVNCSFNQILTVFGFNVISETIKLQLKVEFFWRVDNSSLDIVKYAALLTCLFKNIYFSGKKLCQTWYWRAMIDPTHSCFM